MLNAQENECRAKEAESLEQAKQTNDKDLKHLHETIARQWRWLRIAGSASECPGRLDFGGQDRCRARCPARSAYRNPT